MCGDGEGLGGAHISTHTLKRGVERGGSKEAGAF